MEKTVSRWAPFYCYFNHEIVVYIKYQIVAIAFCIVVKVDATESLWREIVTWFDIYLCTIIDFESFNSYHFSDLYAFSLIDIVFVVLRFHIKKKMAKQLQSRFSKVKKTLLGRYINISC